MSSSSRQKAPLSAKEPATDRAIPGKDPVTEPRAKEATQTELEEDPSLGDSHSASEEGRDLYGEDDYPAEDEEYVSPEAAESTGTKRGGGGTLVGKQPPRAPPPDDSADATRAGPPVKLEVVNGPDEGEVKRFKGVRMVVGRIPGCDLVLTDQSVSRRHLELIQGSRGVLLRDLESGNGTKVNGERVGERVLQHGDEIALGNTKLKFVDEMVLFQLTREEEERKKREEEQRVVAEALAREAEEQAQDQEEEDEEQEEDEGEDDEEGEEDDETGSTDSREPTAAMPQKKGFFSFLPRQRTVALVAGGIVLFGVLGVYVGTRKAPPPPVRPEEELARKEYNWAHLAFDEDRFQDAVDRIDRAERLSPGIDSEGLATQARTELAALKCLDQAQNLIAQQRFEDGQAQLMACPEASEKRNRDRARLQELLSAQQTQAVESGIQHALAINDFDTAERLVQLLPPARQEAWKAKLAEKRAIFVAEKAAEEKKQREIAEAREAQEKAQRMETAFGSVGRKLNEGAYERATLECDRVIEMFGKDQDVRERALKIKRLIPRFARQYAEGVRRAQNPDSRGSAYQLLQAAADLYGDIGLPGALDAELTANLNAAAALVGRDAMERMDYGTAAAAYRGILDRTPEDATAKEGLEHLAAKAEDLYRLAYMVRDRDPKQSIQLLRSVLEITPRSSPLYQKAKDLLKLMQP